MRVKDKLRKVHSGLPAELIRQSYPVDISLVKKRNVERIPVDMPSSESDLNNSQDPKYKSTCVRRRAFSKL